MLKIFVKQSSKIRIAIVCGLLIAIVLFVIFAPVVPTSVDVVWPPHQLMGVPTPAPSFISISYYFFGTGTVYISNNFSICFGFYQRQDNSYWSNSNKCSILYSHTIYALNEQVTCHCTTTEATNTSQSKTPEIEQRIVQLVTSEEVNKTGWIAYIFQ